MYTTLICLVAVGGIALSIVLHVKAMRELRWRAAEADMQASET